MPFGKAQIEVQVVVHRMEFATPDEVQILAFGIESRVGVVQYRFRDGLLFAVVRSQMRSSVVYAVGLYP